jgi:hypothetical protein
MGKTGAHIPQKWLDGHDTAHSLLMYATAPPEGGVRRAGSAELDIRGNPDARAPAPGDALPAGVDSRNA